MPVNCYHCGFELSDGDRGYLTYEGGVVRHICDRCDRKRLNNRLMVLECEIVDHLGGTDTVDLNRPENAYNESLKSH